MNAVSPAILMRKSLVWNVVEFIGDWSSAFISFQLLAVTVVEGSTPDDCDYIPGNSASQRNEIRQGFVYRFYRRSSIFHADGFDQWGNTGNARSPSCKHHSIPFSLELFRDGSSCLHSNQHFFRQAVAGSPVVCLQPIGEILSNFHADFGILPSNVLDLPRPCIEGFPVKS
jgi:hypothetical protein